MDTLVFKGYHITLWIFHYLSPLFATLSLLSTNKTFLMCRSRFNSECNFMDKKLSELARNPSDQKECQEEADALIHARPEAEMQWYWCYKSSYCCSSSATSQWRRVGLSGNSLSQKETEVLNSLTSNTHEAIMVFVPGREDLTGLMYTTMCIKEAIGMHCPIPFVGQETKEAFELEGITLLPGTLLDVSTHLLHHSPDVWGDDHNYGDLWF